MPALPRLIPTCLVWQLTDLAPLAPSPLPQGLRSLLDLLLAPDDLLSGSPTAAQLGRCSGGSGSGSAGRSSSSLCRETVLPRQAGASSDAGVARLCTKPGSEQHLHDAAARSQAVLAAAMQQRQASGCGGGKPAPAPAPAQLGDGKGGPPQLRRNTIHLVVSSGSLLELPGGGQLCPIKTGSAGDLEKQAGQVCRLRRPGSRHPEPAAPRQAATTPRGTRPKQSGLSGLRRALTLPARFVRSGGVAAAVAAALASPRAAVAAAAGAVGGGSSQAAGAVPPSSSCGNLAAADQEQHGQLGAPIHERRLTLEGWAEGPGSPSAAPAYSPHHAQQQQQQAQHGFGAAGWGLTPASPQRSPSPLGRRCSPPPHSRGGGALPLPGPFIHLIGELSAASVIDRLWCLPGKKTSSHRSPSTHWPHAQLPCSLC